MRRGRLGIRKSLLFVLLAIVISMTSLFLLLAGFTVNRQVGRTSLAEMARARQTFQAIEQQRQDLLLRQTSLLSELPSLKALMTTNDQPTIVDGGRTFWQTSGSDIFALMRPDGTLLAVYSSGHSLPFDDCVVPMARSRDTPYRTTLMLISGRLFEVATEPISFAAGEERRVLGYISTGYELNDHMASMVGLSPAGQLLFAAPDRVIASTLDATQVRTLTPAIMASLSRNELTHNVKLGDETYMASSVLLQRPTDKTPSIYLILLQSDKEKTSLLRQLNGGILAIGLLLLLVGSGITLALAATVIRPLEELLQSTRQMERGEVIAPVPATGPQELWELRKAFEKMHAEVLSSQAKLVEGERQATIGRLASSISHDLRHYLSPIYANAEFLSSKALSSEERNELLNEISDAARGMTELLDAILTFSRTGIPVQLAPDSITAAVRRALAMITPHPDARGVIIQTGGLAELAGRIDGKELQRAVYNLLLNASQAALRSSSPPAIGITLQPETDPNGNTVAATVFNSTTGFLLSNGSKASFLFASLDGSIWGWNGKLGTTGSISLKAIDNSATKAVYTAIALDPSAGGTVLLAANFGAAAKVEVYNQSFAPAALAGSFTDPNVPAGYAPYAIHVISNQVYVTYMLRSTSTYSETLGTNTGFISVFDVNGNFIKRAITGGNLNAPWGMALAPTGFGIYGGDLLVGNLGDGLINVYDPNTYAYLGQVTDATGAPILSKYPGAGNSNSYVGLWEIVFGNGVVNGTPSTTNAGDPNTLYFAAGLDAETHGVFGSISPNAATGTPNFGFSTSSSVATVANDASTSLTLAVAPINGFSGSVTFTCSGLPANSTCTFGSPTLTVMPNASATETLTISTGGYKASKQTAPIHPFGGGSCTAIAFLPFACVLLFVGRKRLRISPKLMIVLIGTAVGAATLAGCGSYTDTTTPAGTTAVTVTATSGATSHTSIINLAVQ